ncbi:MAG: ribonuclease D [Alphaproteobacteria bacterium]
MLITSQKALEEFCAGLRSETFLTVDTEFLREKTYYPKLCLVQIGAADGRAAAVDPLAEGIDLAPVYDLLFNPDILKIFHAARQDLEIFYNLTGKVPAPLFDTQIAAMVCGYGEQVGYEALVRDITDGNIDKSVQYTNWSVRPLSDVQVEYALGDVTHLVKIYEHLRDKLEARGRTHWVFEEEAVLNDPATYAAPVEDVWQRVKVKSPKPQTLAVLKALAAWREVRARKKDIPKNWVMRDETLADMAARCPKDVKGLKKIRNMSDKVAEGNSGAEILKLIKDALASDPAGWPAVTKKKPPSARVTAITEILRMLLKIRAAEEGVAAKLIATPADLEGVAKDDAADVAVLSGWRREIFGEDALRLKNGEIAIGLKDGRIAVIETS